MRRHGPRRAAACGRVRPPAASPRRGPIPARPDNRRVTPPPHPRRGSPNRLIPVAPPPPPPRPPLGMRVLASAPGPALSFVVLYPAPRELPAFQLDRSDGGKLTLDDWKGRWTVVFFGYTNCPDVCPTTLSDFKQAWKRLPAEARQRV